MSEKINMAKRKMYNTTLDADLIKEIRILAAQLEKRQNDLLEEVAFCHLQMVNIIIEGWSNELKS
jgi:hypothetical protein